MSLLLKYLKPLLGFHTSRKIIVFESDDWGSIRMPSREVYENFKKLGFNMEHGQSGRYNRYDSLATVEDLTELFQVLTSVKDCKGRNCVMTPMSLVANPDFKRIRESDFRNYYFEPFTSTLGRYPGCQNSFELWKEGISSGIFIPQFHGREHLNISRWLDGLQEGGHDLHLAFENEFWGYPQRLGSYKPEKSLQAAFDLDKSSELLIHESILREGLALFEQLFGYKASCFVPPNGPFNSSLEKVTADEGIEFLQTARLLYSEPLGNGKTRKRFRYLGKRNKHGQLYLIRNCFFEPNEYASFNWVDKCFYDVELAFKFRQPAIVSSHRVNYIGALFPENRRNSLTQLRSLLNRICKKYPEVEFMTSSQLGKIIEGDEF